MKQCQAAISTECVLRRDVDNSDVSKKQSYVKSWQDMVAFVFNDFEASCKDISQDVIKPSTLHDLYKAIQNMYLIKQDWYLQELDTCKDIDPVIYDSFLSLLSKAEEKYQQLVRDVTDEFECKFKQASEAMHNLSLAMVPCIVRKLYQVIQNIIQVRDDWATGDIDGSSDIYQTIFDHFSVLLPKITERSRPLAQRLVEIYGLQLDRQYDHSKALLKESNTWSRQWLGAASISKAYEALCESPDISYVFLFANLFVEYSELMHEVSPISNSGTPLDPGVRDQLLYP